MMASNPKTQLLNQKAKLLLLLWLQVGDSSVKEALVQADVHELLLNDYLARRQELVTTGVRGDLIKKGCLRAIKKMIGMDLTLMLRGGDDAAAADDDGNDDDDGSGDGSSEVEGEGEGEDDGVV